MTAPSVYGVQEVMRELRNLDTTMQRAVVRDAKRAAAPLQQAVAGALPSSPPLSGFAHAGRTGWRVPEATITYGGRRKRDRHVWPLLRVVVRDAWAALYDRAGTGDLGARLPGAPSRSVWPAAERALPAVQAAVIAALDGAAREVNRRLARKPVA